MCAFDEIYQNTIYQMKAKSPVIPFFYLLQRSWSHLQLQFPAKTLNETNKNQFIWNLYKMAK